MDKRIEYRRLRAPSENAQTLLEPPASNVLEMLQTNARRHAGRDYDVQGRSYLKLVDSARAELLTKARRYTQQYRDLDGPDPDHPFPILLAGHQPELFHPGVWFKNLTLGALAERLGAVAVNLLIDSDTVKHAAVRVPGGTAADPTDNWVAYDTPGAEIPFEERAISDRDVFRSFGERAVRTLRPLVGEPILETLWPLAVQRSELHDNLGQCLAQARHQFEGHWRLSSLELPQSEVCSIEAFYWFVAHLLAQLPRLWEAYNTALADYRRVNRVRSQAHPVPRLSSAQEWLEVPLWIWDKNDPRRRPAFARQRGEEILLSDRQHLNVSLSLGPESDAHQAVQQLADLPQQGVKLRTRATITTMFARLFLGDLFVHGIGGAKYDEMTDQLIRLFFGFPPPEFMVASATLRLPISRPQVNIHSETEIGQILRELEFHPERYIQISSILSSTEREEVERHVESKRRWIHTPRTPDNARTRHIGITQANQALQTWVADERSRWIKQLQHVAPALRKEAILSSREYAFCLFPEDALQEGLSLEV